MEEMKLWLFDLAHGNLTDEQVLQGVIRFYILEDKCLSRIRQDILFHTEYGESGVKVAESCLRTALEKYERKGEKDGIIQKKTAQKIPGFDEKHKEG